MWTRLEGLPPNPSGAHRLARGTKAVLEEARDRVAAVLGVPARRVIFTGGGTEACNMALSIRPAPSSFFLSAVEHVAVLAPARARATHLTLLDVSADGVLDVDRATQLITEGAFVSVMAANNETGVVQPVVELSRALGDRREAVVLHSDAIAAAPTQDLSELCANVDLVSLAGHKLGGPPGIGVLVVAEEVTLDPLHLGGSQERELRPGTQDVAAAVGMAVALELAQLDRLEGRVMEMGERRDRLAASLRALPGVTVTGEGAERMESHLHLLVAGARSEEMLLSLDQQGICAAAGAACASGAPQASRVLLAMGISPERARGSLRLTLSTSTTDEEIQRSSHVLSEVISQLRG